MGAQMTKTGRIIIRIKAAPQIIWKGGAAIDPAVYPVAARVAAF